jgi:hypothetical protein
MPGDCKICRKKSKICKGRRQRKNAGGIPARAFAYCYLIYPFRAPLISFVSAVMISRAVPSSRARTS